MGVKPNSLLTYAALGLFLNVGCLKAAAETDQGSQRPQTLSAIELSERGAEARYFSKTLALALDLRPERLISADDFSLMQGLENAVILDTRSAEAYAKSHLGGALSLPLTDMTELSLAVTMPSRTVPILLYSDQNFGGAAGPIMHDSSDLSLNLLSFLTLTQYGYENVYELGERLDLSDVRFQWETPELTAELAQTAAAVTLLD